MKMAINDMLGCFLNSFRKKQKRFLAGNDKNEEEDE